MINVLSLFCPQVPLEFRAMVQLGCLCVVDTSVARSDTDTFELNQLRFKTVSEYSYLEEGSMHHVYFYHHVSGNKALFGFFFNHNKRAHIFALDTVRTNQMPNLQYVYNKQRKALIDNGIAESSLPEHNFSFFINIETDMMKITILINRVLRNYRDEKKGPTLLAIQSPLTLASLTSLLPEIGDFPQVPIHVTDPESLYNVLNWQQKGVGVMVKHFLRIKQILFTSMDRSRYFHIPIGNLPRDPTAFGADLFYARHLQKHNAILWASPGPRPDLGGHEHDENRQMLDTDGANATSQINHPNCYTTVCVELDIDALAVTTILQVS